MRVGAVRHSHRLGTNSHLCYSIEAKHSRVITRNLQVWRKIQGSLGQWTAKDKKLIRGKEQGNRMVAVELSCTMQQRLPLWSKYDNENQLKLTVCPYCIRTTLRPGPLQYHRWERLLSSPLAWPNNREKYGCSFFECWTPAALEPRLKIHWLQGSSA